MTNAPSKPSRTGSAPTVRGSAAKKPGVFKRLVRRVKSAFSFRRNAGRVAPSAYAPSPISTGDSDAVVLVTAGDLGTTTPTSAAGSRASPSPFRTPTLKAGHSHTRSMSNHSHSHNNNNNNNNKHTVVGSAGAGAGAGATTPSVRKADSSATSAAAVAASPMSSVAAGSGVDGSLSPLSASVAPTPTEEEDPFFVLAADVFGPAFKAEMCSDKWQDRQQLLKRITSVITSGTIKVVDSVEDRLKLLECVCGLVVRCLADKVAPVTWAVMEVFWSYITSDLCVFGRDAGMASGPLTSVVAPLLNKMAEKNARSSRDARKCLLALARNRGLAGFSVVAPVLVDASNPLQPRLDILLDLVPEFKFRKGSALSPATVLSVAVPALQIAHDVTRKSAIDVVVATYKVVGKRVQGHLKDVKPAILKILHRRFNEVDGIHTHPSRPTRGSNSAASSENRASMSRYKSGMLSPLKPSGLQSRSGAAYLPTLSLGSPTAHGAPTPDLVPRDTNVLPSLTGTASTRYFDAQDEALMSSILTADVL